MLERVICITIIIFLLLAQASQAFAISSMSCFGNNIKTTHAMPQNMHDENVEASSPKADRMLSSMTAGSFDKSHDSMTHECCQQECDCPSTMLSGAALFDINAQAFFAAKYSLFIYAANGLAQVFIPSQQRPPKLLYFL